ncbi:MAG: glycerate kinase, partial [Muribaculaceae bacterium]|nr:glycerate kinase [Muribaculaceae bacterium]
HTTLTRHMQLTSLFKRQHNSRAHHLAAPMIVVAPDKFKGTLSATEVAGTIAQALKARMPSAKVRICPMADGGEGTAAILAEELHLSPAVTPGHDAMMNPIELHYFTDGTTCAVDAAAIVGLAMLSQTPLRPWDATTFGIGEFIVEMLRQDMSRVIVCIGGTATVDAGAGMLQALGARFFDVDGAPINISPITASHLSIIYSVDFSGIDHNPIKQRVTALADVDVPLLPDAPGEMSALDFAAQKGISAIELPMLRAAFDNFATAVDNALYPPAQQPRFQGAGGGLGYALHRVLRCECAKGADHILNHYHLFNHADKTGTPPSSSAPSVRNPECIITGEGCFDAQSLHGKVTGTIIEHATAAHIPVIVVAGRCDGQHLSIPDGVKVITTAQYLTDTTHKTPAEQPAKQISRHDAIEALHKALPLIADAVTEFHQSNNHL